MSVSVFANTYNVSDFLSGVLPAFLQFIVKLGLEHFAEETLELVCSVLIALFEWCSSRSLVSCRGLSKLLLIWKGDHKHCGTIHCETVPMTFDSRPAILTGTGLCV